MTRQPPKPTRSLTATQLAHQKLIISLTTIGLLFLGAVNCPLGAALVSLTIPVYVVYLIRIAYFSLFKRSALDRYTFIFAGLWLVAMAGLFETCECLQANRQRLADHIIEDIVAYKAHHGAYPTTLLSVSTQDFFQAKKQGILYHYYREFGPQLYYLNAFTTDYNSYDFAGKKWNSYD